MSESKPELAVGVSARDGKVRLDFSQSITWLELRPDQAGGLASAIINMMERAIDQRPRAEERPS